LSNLRKKLLEIAAIETIGAVNIDAVVDDLFDATFKTQSAVKALLGVLSKDAV
jgi:hypothetical protein